MILSIQTYKKTEFIDITSKVLAEVKRSRISDGLCMIYVPHTTAGITINEAADPSVKEDIIMALNKMIPETLNYGHAEGNSPAHVKSSLVGVSTTVAIEKDELVLGTWQGIFFCEFDGPRNRKVYLKFINNDIKKRAGVNYS
ncbi:MAG: YjbQ family protein [Desulfobacterales bacterium]|nr:YjbQ family protein [Desulfobacterales bacterium]